MAFQSKPFLGNVQLNVISQRLTVDKSRVSFWKTNDFWLNKITASFQEMNLSL